MTVIEFNFNDDWMGEISRRLGGLNDKTPDVISQATNSTARKARKLIVQSLREHYAEDAKTKISIHALLAESDNAWPCAMF